MLQTVTGNAIDLPLPPIPATVNALVGAQSTTHDLITELIGRLEGVSVFPAPEASSKAGPAPVLGGASPLHCQLVERLDHAEGINGRLRKILGALTV